MIDIFLYISTGMVLLGFICYILIIFIGKNKIVTKSNGFDITKDIISLYNSINIIESKGYFSIYNIKRKVIKLSTICYYGSDLSSISLSLIEAGISVIDNNKNKYINLFRNVFSNLKLLYMFPLVSLFINNSSFYVSDAKVSIIILLIFSFILYIFLEIKNEASYWISENLEKINDISKDNCLKIKKFIDRLLLCDRIILFGQIVMVMRMVLILLEIK